ncbi:heme-binding protein [Cupriavidus pinatubonensis]|uniref:heme-binding protein n=1 Tax=Cupriavidus pinatubonensis TaxID=248026 RepID=UPI002159EE3A|nr:heme-binding protein [Cupriavidus pinatubonensis]
MDGAWLGSNELAIAKARSSVMFQAPTEALNAPLQIGKPFLHFDHIHSGGLLLVGGGVPLFDVDRALIGGPGYREALPNRTPLSPARPLRKAISCADKRVGGKSPWGFRRCQIVLAAQGHFPS